MQVQGTTINGTYIKNYSTVNKTNTDYSTVISNNEVVSIFNNSFGDITEPQYYPFYSSRLKELGLKRFTELANLARLSSDTPIRLFNYFLKNPELVRF
jgi:hypothetical protein